MRGYMTRVSGTYIIVFPDVGHGAFYSMYILILY